MIQDGDYVADMADYYATSDECVDRGMLIYQEQPALLTADFAGLVREKACERFSSDSLAPQLPNDPLYVFPRTSLTCNGCDASVIANCVIESAEGMFSNGTISSKVNSAKVSVESQSGMIAKVKIFSKGNGEFLVTFRKDAGDWFAFNAFYIAATKHMKMSGVVVTPSAETSQLFDE